MSAFTRVVAGVLGFSIGVLLGTYLTKIPQGACVYYTNDGKVSKGKYIKRASGIYWIMSNQDEIVTSETVTECEES